MRDVTEMLRRLYRWNYCCFINVFGKNSMKNNYTYLVADENQFHPRRYLLLMFELVMKICKKQVCALYQRVSWFVLPRHQILY